MQKASGAVKAPNPFNPGSPVDPTDFIGRSRELEGFRQKLLQTANGSLASMAVAGGYGVGKTSFLHKCKAIAEEQKALTIYFSLNEIDSLDKETLARVLIERLKEKVREEVILERLSGSAWNALKKIRLKTGVGSLEIGVSENEDFPNLQSALKRAWSALKNNKTAVVVFLIDEARALEKNRAELILYLRSVLEQLQVDRVPVMIVPAGNLSAVVSGTGFSPIVRTFPPSALENFSESESSAFINRKLSSAGVAIKEEALNEVYEVTEGHPFVLSAYMNSAYSKLQAGEKELTKAHLEATNVEFVKVMLANFFSRFYDQTSKISNKILLTIAESDKGEASLSDLSSKLKKESNELSPHLGKLVQEGAIVRVERGKYRLFHHLLGEYILEKPSF